jgi:hypothetical protein
LFFRVFIGYFRDNIKCLVFLRIKKQIKYICPINGKTIPLEQQFQIRCFAGRFVMELHYFDEDKEFALVTEKSPPLLIKT